MHKTNFYWVQTKKNVNISKAIKIKSNKNFPVQKLETFIGNEQFFFQLAPNRKYNYVELNNCFSIKEEKTRYLSK